MEYFQMTESTVEEYVKKIGMFANESVLATREVGDGNLNLVFIVKEEATGKSVVVKQALPYVRVVGESWPLSIDRTIFEANALEIQSKLAKGLVPEIYHRNDDLALIIMEDLSRLELMRHGMIKMKKYPKFPEHMSTFLADTLFYTSDLYMDSEDKKKMVAKFINTELCKITEDLIFTDPYFDAESNNINPALRPYLEEVFWKKQYLRLETAKLKYKFLTEAQSLIHGDLHTGSIFAGEEETVAFDTEFAFVGPSAFDVGKVIGNFLINYVSWSGKDEEPGKVKDYRDYLLDSINGYYNLFVKKFKANWDKDAKDVIAKVEGYQAHYMENIFRDALGFAAAVMIRRMHGLAHNLDVDGIENEEKRKDVQITILELAEEIMMDRYSFENIEAVTKLVKERIY
ncbi:S-methyl-5-thioribose kinase [Alkaliphilus hydrothermalis]|uniref:S-methyl-5-thioribose kinase n=1 Tax=Alkaliphilus hydrothermalis TaxID=1482730 RepID=A0ABS2NSP7_9FIRM|nr:S-methyl-5-thioribose kinase [Alkaliphilus hydrothermalis]MBM7615941.1 5-methylthioribose kinase [Alkaliphilus hydrothermalis]